jgi:hypothetical protein
MSGRSVESIVRIGFLGLLALRAADASREEIRDDVANSQDVLQRPQLELAVILRHFPKDLAKHVCKLSCRATLCEDLQVFTAGCTGSLRLQLNIALFITFRTPIEIIVVGIVVVVTIMLTRLCGVAPSPGGWWVHSVFAFKATANRRYLSLRLY